MTTDSTQVEFDPNSSQVAEQKPQSEGYWSRVWVSFNKRLINRMSMWMLIGFGTLYIAADLIANGSPLLLRFNGAWYSPWLQRTDSFELRWAQSVAQWVLVRLSVTARVDGTESTRRLDFTLPVAAEDVNDLDITPPNLISPFGTADECVNPS